jgi:hypothetical protein
MQRQQQEAIVELKINEQSQLENNLIRMNEFIPNLSFSQDLFGQLHLNEYSIIDPFKSQILKDKQTSDLIKLCEFSLNDKWTLLYRGTRDGFDLNDFHEKFYDHSKSLPNEFLFSLMNTGCFISTSSTRTRSITSCWIK